MTKSYLTKMFVAGLLCLSGGGIAPALADTSALTGANGWQKITSISQSDIASHYYVFVDNANDLTLHLAASTTQGNQALFYQTTADPTTDLTEVFMLEANGDNYLMRPLTYNGYAMQTEWSGSSNDLRWRTNDQAGAISWTGLGLAYSDGAWTLTSTQYSRPLGIYNNGTGSPAAGSEVGANDAANGQKFQIYAIDRITFSKKLFEGASESSPVSTNLVVNGTLEAPNSQVAAWTSTTSAGNKQVNTSTTSFEGISNRFYENWTSSDGSLKGKISQVINNIPDGKYRLSLGVFAKNEAENGQLGSEGTIYVYANGDQTNVSVTSNPTSGTYTVETNVINNSIEIGLGFTDDNTANWAGIDNAVLYYLGEITDLTVYKTSLQEEINAAGKISPTSDELTTAIATATTALNASDATIESLKAAVSALQKVEEKTEAINEKTKTVEGASESNPIVTSFVVNGTFDVNINGWSTTAVTKHGSDGNSATASNQTGAFKVPFFENYKYNGKLTGKMYQTVENIPNGTYKLSISAFVQTYVENTDYVYAGSDKKYLTTGTPTAYEVYTYVSDNELEFGLSLNGVTQWAGIDNVSLTYYGSENVITNIKNSELINNSKALLDGTNPMNTGVKSELQTAYNNASTNASDDNITALTTAYENAQASVTAYATATTELERRLAVVNSTNFYTADAKATYYDAIKTKYDARTLTTDEANALNNLADRDFLGSTFSFNSSTATSTGDYIYGNTWSTESDGSGDAADFKTPFYETWVADGTNLSQKDYTGSLAVTTAGKYKITLKVRVRINSGTAATCVTMDVNGGTAVTITGNQIGTTARYIDTYTLEGTVGDDKTLKLNIHVADGTNVSWISFRDINYEYIPTATIGSAGWATYVATEDVDLSSNTGLTAYTTKYDASTITLTPISDNLIPSGAAVVLKGNAGTYDLTLATSTVSALSDNALKASDGTVKGGNSIWVLTSKDGQTGFAPTASTLTLPADKGYLEISDGGAKSFIAIDGGAATGINGVATESVDDGAVYNVAGQKVSSSYKGLVIKNGKKYLRK